MSNLDQFIQIERRAYYRIDSVKKQGDEFEYNLILVPDGKKVGLASIKTVTDKKGDIQKQDLSEKVEEKKTKGAPKKEKKEKKNEQKVEEKIEEKSEVKIEGNGEVKT
jgi:hypothetical protein